jgi:hypothetical protein
MDPYFGVMCLYYKSYKICRSYDLCMVRIRILSLSKYQKVYNLYLNMLVDNVIAIIKIVTCLLCNATQINRMGLWIGMNYFIGRLFLHLHVHLFTISVSQILPLL